MEHIVGAHRGEPSQVVYAEPDEGVRPLNTERSAAASSRWKGWGSNSAANLLMSSRVTRLSALLKRMPRTRSSNHSTIAPLPGRTDLEFENPIAAGSYMAGKSGARRAPSILW